MLLYLKIPYDQALIHRVRQVPGAYWNSSLKLWCVRDSDNVRAALQGQGLTDRLVEQDQEGRVAEKPKAQVNLTLKRESSPSQPREDARSRISTKSSPVEALEQMLIREGAAYSTRKSYCSMLGKLTKWYAGDVSKIARQDLLDFLTYCIEELGYSRSTMNQLVNALRAYYERVLGRPKDEFRLPRPRKKRSLPNVCSEEAALRMIREAKNCKHRTILAMIYGLGLRKGEVQKLLVKHLDLGRQVVRIQQAKGNKDRVLPLQPSLRMLLETYLREYRPKHWLFEGRDGAQYSATSIQSIFVQAKERSELPDQLTIHGLRHSYATHLVERGTPIHVVKDLLGHQNIQTTQIYLHTSSQRFKQVYDPLAGL